MERSSVHIAVLVVADDPATVDLASATFLADRAGSAGHRVVAQEIVETREAAIRDQLARWISQPHIDVVIGAGAGEAAVAALGPLVTSPLQGLTDQLRLLSRDRGGAGKPAAARCGAKFVFLLPAEIPALGPALNQLVLPQLDSTQPRNLVGEMPRHQAVPREMPAEKTASGAGLVPKLPASREKRKTGANVIPRSELADATKQTPAGRAPIANDAPTRPHIDIASMLPPVPPGADMDTDEQPAFAEPPLTVQPRNRPHPSSNDKTVVRPTPDADKTAVRPAPTRPASQTNRGVPGTPALGLGGAPRGPIGVAKPTPTSPTVVPSIPSLGRPPTPSAGAPTVKAATPAAGSPSGRPMAPAIAPTPLPSVKAPGSPMGKQPTAPAIAPTPLPTVRMPPSSSTPPAASPVVKPSAPPAEKASAKPLPAATPVSGVQTATAVAAAHETTKAPDTVNTAALAAAADAEELDAASSSDVIEAANILESVPDDEKASFETRTPPPVPPRTPARAPARPALPPETKPVDAATAEAKLAAAAAKPAVTRLQVADLPQPELLDLSEGVAKKRRSRTGTALVRRRTSSTVLMYLALACAAVAGFVAVVHFFPRGSSDDTTPPRGSAAVAVAPVAVIDAAPAPPPPVAPGSGSDTAEIEIQPGSAAAPATETPPPPPPETHPTTRPPAHPAAKPPTAPDVKPPTAPEVKPPTTPETRPAPPPAADGCDEVSCVLEKYQRECCARFKPADSGFHPKNEVPDSLDKTMVRAGIEKVKPKVIACGEKSAAKGTVKLAITVAPEGNITDISVADSPDAALGECVLAAVKRASFGKSVNGASFTFPFAF